MIHAARISRSPRLARVHKLLQDGREHSTWDIIAKAQVCAVNTIVAELRVNGAVIDGRWETRPDGGRHYLYRMTRPAEEAA